MEHVQVLSLGDFVFGFAFLVLIIAALCAALVGWILDRL